MMMKPVNMKWVKLTSEEMASSWLDHGCNQIRFGEKDTRERHLVECESGLLMVADDSGGSNLEDMLHDDPEILIPERSRLV
jgi:hypothetical protein